MPAEPQYKQRIQAIKENAIGLEEKDKVYELSDDDEFY